MAEEFQSPRNHKNVVHRDIIISPRFRSVVVMDGWDEEALLAASLVVEDTPEIESSECQKLTNLASKSPQTNSRRKRRIQRYSPITNPALVLNLDDDDVEARVPGRDGPVAGKGRTEPKFDEVSPANLPCMDKLREELSCAICLEICFEPSTTPCGQSFCKKCLKYAADKCGKKCPKCRQLIGNERSCIVNTSLWNIIQLLFPQEVEARKVVAAKNSREEVKNHSTIRKDSISRSRSGRTNSMVMMKNQSNVRVNYGSRNQSGRSNFMGMNREDSVRLCSSARIRRDRPSQVEDAASALRLVTKRRVYGSF
ncbi:hypothetical protein MKW98_006830 [Papaver atlanticum]|uniref:RING-type E3 ubiquitin transferase n=1 Tax=Papaver atlanticum TaxID=357466 RepID=A0AAD4ST38_9MAGN|nr:hypothetical protein MKW98_006830 [Papaver atlanticum]